ncbi:unnamed protein product [Prorocentrum cordatum]|uniref:Uncharacterized protein n=1 Tax=Prorocentrum cordatum TaxID=2364126 RepID=A0ABN9Y128_9DINO|nr:unnamed protein product [Polarella glacialis]
MVYFFSCPRHPSRPCYRRFESGTLLSGLSRTWSAASSAEVSKALKFLPTLQDLGYSDEDAEAAYVDDPRSAMVWEGGENAAWIRLQRWMFDHDRLKDYRDTQNGMLGEEVGGFFEIEPLDCKRLYLCQTNLE